ncbi:MAG: NAD(P)H-binding protein [Ferruginibacter sp.]|nr:NAD(P)H-binding protein [Ferruginibacter sp.]
MKKALVIGGTGLIGKQLIEQLLADSRYNVIALARKPLAIQHEKLLQPPFDFDHPDNSLIVADEIFCCLGTTIKKAGSKQGFYKVDYQYVLTVARAGYSNGAKKFALVSSLGANKNSGIFYSKTKGEIEEAVTGIGYESLFIFRPSMLLGQRAEFRVGEMIGKLLMKSFAFLIPKKYKAIAGGQVAKAMIDCMNSGKTGVNILASDSIAAF